MVVQVIPWLFVICKCSIAVCSVHCAMCSKCCLISSKSKDIEIRFTVIYTMSVQMSTTTTRTTTHTRKNYMHKWILHMTLLDALHRMNIRKSSHISSKYGWMYPGKNAKRKLSHFNLWNCQSEWKILSIRLPYMSSNDDDTFAYAEKKNNSFYKNEQGKCFV